MKGRDRLVLILGASVIASAIFVLRIAPWAWREIQGSRAQLHARAELAARMRADVGSVTALEDSGTAIRGRVAALAPSLLTGATAGEARADLGARLAAAAERHGVRVKRTDDPLRDSVGGPGLAPVTISAALESDTEGLLDLLGSVAAEPAVLLVDEVRIAVTDPYAAIGRPEILHTELTVRGWYLPGGTSR